MKALYERRSRTRKAVAQVFANVERLQQLDRPPICELRRIHLNLIEQYEELKRIDKEVENAVDMDHLEAEMEKADV